MVVKITPSNRISSIHLAPIMPCPASIYCKEEYEKC